MRRQIERSFSVKKKTNEAKYKYLVKVARTKKALESSYPMPFKSWMFWDRNYRVTKSGVAMSCFDSKDEAQKAIDRERLLLKRESETFKRDVAIIKCNGMEKRYRGILAFMTTKVSPYLIGRPPVFKIVQVKADEWEKLWR